MTVVTFESYRPAARFDGIPWTHALIHESPTGTGPWTLIETINFPDPDVDPTDPKARYFTTDNATLPYGWYRITFTDATGASAQPTAPVYNGPVYTYEPTVDQVARKVLSRTRDKFGKTLGTFTPDTEPTGAQVQAIVDDVVTEVADVIGDDIPQAFWDDASNVVALRAAMQIELDFFADQVNTGRSIYPQLLAQYNSALAALSSSIAASNDGTVVSSSPAMKPSSSFPDPYFTLDKVW